MVCFFLIGEASFGGVQQTKDKECGGGREADAVHERVKETHSDKETRFHGGGKNTRKLSSPAPKNQEGYSPHFFAVAALAMFFTRHAFLFLTKRM